MVGTINFFMNKLKKIKSVNNEVNTAAFEAIKAYIDYMIGNGAKEVHIEFDDGFTIATDNVLTKEMMKSKEFQTLVFNLHKALAK